MITSRPSIVRALLLAMFLLPLVARAQVAFVDDDSAAGGDGTTWNTAYRYLQDALAAAADDPTIVEIRVAGGLQRPDRGQLQTPGDRNATFALRTGLAVLGGFRGLAPGGDANERDLAAFASVLSGDLAGNDQPNWVNHGENSRRLVTATGVGPSGVLDGFTVRDGYFADVNGHGAGLSCNGGGPTIRNCRFVGNLAFMGAAVSNLASSPEFVDCEFSGNYAWSGRAGALYNASFSNPRLTRCAFVGNRATSGGGVCDGGAMFNEFDTAPALRFCTFRDNVTFAPGPNGGMYANGGAICSLGEGMLLENCVFVHNSAVGGGGAIWSGRLATLRGCVFSRNTAAAGGGLSLFVGGGALLNCTFSANAAGDGGGIFNGAQTPVAIVNCILWGNTANNAPSDYKAQIHNADFYPSTVDLSYSCVQGVFTPEPGEDPPNPADFPGCTEANPLFANSAADDLRVQSGSPCIDAGDNLALPAGFAMDADARPRRLDDCQKPDTGRGTAPLVDMGAHEFVAAPLVVQPPNSQTVTAGQSVSFSVVAVGRPGLSYQWRRDGAALADGPGAGGLISGATTAMLTITGVAAADAGSYDVVVGNSCGSATSAAATLTVRSASRRGDLNCDGLVNNFDIDPFVLALSDPAAYAVAYPDCDRMNADTNADGLVNNFDIDPFVVLIGGGTP